jgi:Fe-S-cluster containining protein
MLLVGDEQRCVALRGTLRDDVTCTVYRHRPEACRTVEAGDEECLRARRYWQLPLTAAGERRRLGS